MDNETFLVTGVTGQQGGAVARHLLTDGRKVLAFVRDPDKEASQALKSLGAELVKGDLDDADSLNSALAGVHAVFSVQNFQLPDVGLEGEIRQGKALIDAAQVADVQHFVYSSVGGAHRGEGQRHFEGKWEIEQYLKSRDQPHTIVRPTAFMDNFEWSRVAISNGTLQSWGICPDKRTQLIAVDDIGAIVAIVFSSRSKYLGKTLEIAGDELTESEQTETLAKVIGRPVELVRPQAKRADLNSPEQEAMARFYNGEAYAADIPSLRKVHPGLLTFEQYLRGAGWENLPELPTTAEG